MRSYPRNSPQAAARIVSLAVLCDGHMSKAELDLLDRLNVHEQLGLDRAELHRITHTFCEDLLATSAAGGAHACEVDPYTMAELLSEVDDPVLRRKVLSLCVAVAEADDHLADGESSLLVAAVEYWGLQREMLEERLTAVS